MLPCPFCNSLKITVVKIHQLDHKEKFVVVCNYCKGRGPEVATVDKATAMWNQRAMLNGKV